MSAKDFVQCAREQLGKQYVWGTAGPNTFDCSGLVSYCYERVMHAPMTRSSHLQYLEGDPVEDLAPGDLVFWNTDGSGASHVAIYEEGAGVIHALNDQRDVCRSAVNAPMGGPMIGARRLDLGDGPLPPKVKRRKHRRKKKR